MRASDAGASTKLFIVQWARGKGSSPGRVEGSSRAMLATARLSFKWLQSHCSGANFFSIDHRLKREVPLYVGHRVVGTSAA